MRTKKPKVSTKCVANAFTGPNERIVEYSFPGTDGPGGFRLGGLIRFYLDADGIPHVSLYRHDKGIEIHVDAPE